MAYKLAILNSLQVERLKKVVPLNQSEIIDTTGEPLDLNKAYHALKEASNYFKEENKAFEQLDNEIYQYLDKKGFFVTDGIERKRTTDKPSNQKPIISFKNHIFNLKNVLK